ncbi:MAG: protein phosphatase 2C domain-containing protein [Myxococcaceae bacterium]
MNTTSAGVTLVGRRSNNEDAMLDCSPLGLFAVCDGLGGYEGGEIASRLATTTLEQFVDRNRRDPLGTWPVKEDRSRSYEENLLAAATVEAHRAILGQKSGRLSQMGSTVVAALFHGGRVSVVHCGDSRAYRLRDGAVTQLTVDHSVWAEMQAAGLAGPRGEFQFKNQITRALGLDGHAKADVRTFDVQPGDVYLLCSDGLYDPLDDARLKVGLSLSPSDACDDLARAAFEAGSADNITAVVVRTGE